MATMRDVAALANVSAKTVSRVFNDDPHVLPETRARVEAALRQVSYVPNTLARNFRAGRAPAVGIAVPSLADPFFAAIVDAVDAEAKQHDLFTVVTSLGDDSDREPEVVESLLSRQLGGLILAPITANQRYLTPWLSRVPTVFVDRPPVGITVDSFTEDNEEGGYLATEHLISHGHRRIAFLGDDPLTTTTAAGRLAGYTRALGEHGIDFDQRLVAAHPALLSRGPEALSNLMREGAPTAIFSSNARTSIALMPVIKLSNLAVVGFGDFSMADMLTPSITVIDQDPALLGRLAAQRLADRIAHPGRRMRRKTVLSVGLLERESCATGVPSLALQAPRIRAV
jgi:LacI family transcriptional regulator